MHAVTKEDERDFANDDADDESPVFSPQERRRESREERGKLVENLQCEFAIECEFSAEVHDADIGEPLDKNRRRKPIDNRLHARVTKEAAGWRGKRGKGH